MESYPVRGSSWDLDYATCNGHDMLLFVSPAQKHGAMDVLQGSAGDLAVRLAMHVQCSKYSDQAGSGNICDVNQVGGSEKNRG